MTISREALNYLELDSLSELRAVEIHNRSIIVNCCAIIAYNIDRHAQARASGVTATNHTVTSPSSGLNEALAEVVDCRGWIRENSDHVLLATSVADIERAKATDREAIIFGPQSTDFLGKDLRFVDPFYDLGIRVIQLTYQRQNWVGTGCGEKRDGGLTKFGKELVDYLDEIGVVIDLSHCGPLTSSNSIERSSNPVIFSHAHPYSLSPHIRAKSDDLIKLLANRGGVIGVTALSPFVANPARPDQRPDLTDLIRHIDYLVDLVGIEHVGIGLDFDDSATLETWSDGHQIHPELDSRWSFEERRIHNLSRPVELPKMSRALVSAGYSDDDIRKILGENFLRVFRHVWGE